MKRRQRSYPLAFSFAILVIAAHTHCVMAHGAELLRDIQGAGSPSPVAPSEPSCENESGCICRGATLVAAVQPPDHFAGLVNGLAALWVAHRCSAERLGLLPESGALVCTEPPPLYFSAISARIELQSFQL